MEALSAAHAPPEDVAVLGGVVRGTAAVHLHVGFDEVGHVAERERVALRAVAVGEVGVVLTFLERAADRAGGDGAVDLVAEERGAADGVEHGDPADAPPELGLPVDGLEHAARRRRRHHVVADTLGFHLGPGEAGIVAPDFQRERGRCGHQITESK